MTQARLSSLSVQGASSTSADTFVFFRFYLPSISSALFLVPFLLLHLHFFTPLSGSMSHKESPGAASECRRRDGRQEPPGDGASCAASLGGGASLEGGASDSLVSIKAQVKLQGDKVRQGRAHVSL